MKEPQLPLRTTVPQTGFYTGERIQYGHDYEIRVRLYQGKRRWDGWDSRVVWDVFHLGEFEVSALSRWFAEEHIIKATFD